MIFTTLAISLIMCANRVTLAAVALGKAQEHPSKFSFFVGHLGLAHQIVLRNFRCTNLLFLFRETEFTYLS